MLKMEIKKWWILICFCVGFSSCEIQPWTYKCDSFRRCVKDRVHDPNEVTGLSLAECLLTCDSDNSVVWPKPREAKFGRKVVPFELEGIEFTNRDQLRSIETVKWLSKNLDEQIEWAKKKKEFKSPANNVGNLLSININLEKDQHEDEPPQISKQSKEYYTLSVKYSPEDKTIKVEIQSEAYFGARHALETLFQLIEYDPIRKTYIVLDDVQISDYPEFVHRGVSLDTARNFITVDVIKRIIDGMAHSKLNVFHWHATDTNTFPIEVKGSLVSQMNQYGTYGRDQIYTQEDVKDIVQYASYRGVRVIPELDQPAHVANGWNFPGAEDLTVCANEQPWYDLCYQPPCGQLNPTKERVYEILEQIYSEWYDMFEFDTFHMGADEVKFGCWNKSDDIVAYMEQNGMPRTTEGFIQLWSDFQVKSSSKLQKTFDEKAPEDSDLDVIVWTSKLTKREHIKNLPNDQYIVQIWTNASDISDDQIKALADENYRMIFSNYDSLYLDCGFSAWIGEGNNWCTPYKGWQKIYSNDPYKHLSERSVPLTKRKKALVLGGEVCMWTEQADSEIVEGKIFPRASALGERLWSSPDEHWYEAETRLLHHRLRLTHRGVHTDALQPEWCRQNTGQCYVGEHNPWNN